MTDRRVRVVFCIDNMGLGGTELNAVRVAERLDPRRFDLSVACLRKDGPLAKRYESAGIRVDAFPLRSLAGVSAAREGVRFASMLVRDRVDIVHAHDRYTNVFAVPWARMVGTAGVMASRRWGKMEHGHAGANRVAYRMAHRVIANSEAVGALLVSDDGVRADRITVVPNFVDDEAFADPPASWYETMRRALDLPANAITIGIVARLSPIKDHSMLFRAIGQIESRRSDIVLVLFGDGPEEPALRRLASGLGIDPVVRFGGARSNVPNLHRLFDISVLTSRSEGFPNTLVEAMAAARPIVSTAVGGVVDAVQDEHTGLLVRVGDTEALARALERLIDNIELRRSMGDAGRRRAAALFSVEHVIPLLENLYIRASRRRA